MSHIAVLPEIQATKSDFWSRLFFGPRTRRGSILDVLFGIVAPIFCFAADPGVMFGGQYFGWGLPSIAPLSILAVAALSMPALVVLLAFGGRWGTLDAVLAGILLAGAAVAFLVGLGLLPFALVGLIFLLLGAPGFLPLITSIVCLRNATRTLASAPARRGLATLVALAVLVFAAGYQVAADRVLDTMVADIARTGSPAAIANLERWRPLLPRREMMRRRNALRLEHPSRSTQYAIAYERVTGEGMRMSGRFD